MTRRRSRRAVIGVGRCGRAARISAVDSTTTVDAARGGERHRGSPRPASPRAHGRAPLGDRDAHLPVERLPMKRTGSMGSRVPPALTTIVAAGRGPPRGPVDRWRGRAAGSRRTGREPIAPTTASTMRGSSASRPRRLAGRERPASARRSCSRRRPQAGDVVARRRVRPHVAVHRGRDDDRRTGREAVRRHARRRRARSPSRQPVRGRRATTIASAGRRRRCGRCAVGRSAGRRSRPACRDRACERQRAHERGRGGVSIATTSAPSARSRRSSSTPCMPRSSR
jgi:hypothetical protein